MNMKIKQHLYRPVFKKNKFINNLPSCLLINTDKYCFKNENFFLKQFGESKHNITLSSCLLCYDFRSPKIFMT